MGTSEKERVFGVNLQKLFKVQAELDKKIIEEKGLEGQDLLDKKILALQVELGELANELPEEFKFWANKYNDREKALKEYVDCLHFILSIGLEIGVCQEELDVEPIFCANVKEQFIDLFYEVSHLRYEERNGRLYEDYLRYDIVLEHFVGLGEMLGFTWEEVEQAYYTKNKENHERQENSY